MIKVSGYESSVLSFAKSAWDDRQGDTNLADSRERAAAKRLAEKGLVVFTAAQPIVPGGRKIPHVKITDAGLAFLAAKAVA